MVENRENMAKGRSGTGETKNPLGKERVAWKTDVLQGPLWRRTGLDSEGQTVRTRDGGRKECGGTVDHSEERKGRFRLPQKRRGETRRQAAIFGFLFSRRTLPATGPGERRRREDVALDCDQSIRGRPGGPTLPARLRQGASAHGQMTENKKAATRWGRG
jgi:hypothetical protein